MTARSTPRVTAEIIAAMKPGEVLPDPMHPGLRVVAGLRGKTFVYRYRDGARLKQVKLGVFGQMTLTDARDALAALKVERKKGADPVEAKRTAKVEKKAETAAREAERKASEMTLADIIEHYLAEHVDLERQAKSAAEARRLLHSPDLAGIRQKPVAEVTRTEAVELIATIAKRARVIAGNTRTELRAAFEHAVDSGRINTANPFAFRAKKSLSPQKRDRVLLDAEVRELVKWMPTGYSETVRDALMLTLLTGLRSGEIVAIESTEIEEGPGGMVVTIPAAKAKNGQAWRCPVPRQAAEIIRRRMGGKFLFPGRDGKRPIHQKVLGVEIWAHSPTNANERYANRDRCPVAGWGAHDLRRTCRTNLARLGCPPDVGEAILCHAKPGVAGIYDRYAAEPEKRLWLQRWADHLDTMAPRIWAVAA